MCSLLTTEWSSPGADVLVVTNLWPRADHTNYGVFVKRQIESLLEQGVRCDVLFVRGYRSQLAYPLLAMTLLWHSIRRTHSYRLVHAHGGEVVPFARSYLRAPLLASFYGQDLLGTPRADGTMSRPNRIKAWLLRRLARTAGATITQSREMERCLPPAVRRRNTVLPSGVDRDLFRPEPRNRARARLGWMPEDRVVLFAGDPAVERKRYWLACAAVEEAMRVNPCVRLEVATGVPPEAMSTLMSAADCLILTSVSEGSPNVVKEALAVGLPVVTTKAGDVAELLAGVEPSEVCEAEPRALAGAVIRCVMTPQRSNGRARSEGLGSAEIADRLLAIYARVAAAGGQLAKSDGVGVSSSSGRAVT